MPAAPHVRTATITSGVVAAAPLAWWLGSLIPANDVDDPDHLIDPPDVTTATETAIGLAALALVAIASVWLAATIRAERVHRLWSVVVAMVAGVAAYIGLTYRVATLPRAGANVGGGLMIMGIVPIGVAGGVMALLAFRALRYQQRIAAYELASDDHG